MLKSLELGAKTYNERQLQIIESLDGFVAETYFNSKDSHKNLSIKYNIAKNYIENMALEFGDEEVSQYLKKLEFNYYKNQYTLETL
jgi:hypothetical protein